ncbi:unnamed protein product [Rotaria sp. Silwood1]|nr:unnamed protein product [Rotaria sp. Silwood1]CAF3946642.1 unnamed protein product [Rotaria sp. Silwood1]CAF4761615.1 unnamed protein product [Rotaria sp. Silwood1]CAF4995256.1 unnamed protein product [Rotaria sp. Silwood1]CAF5097950.1 unnamed protein product [Rotaria sp. Silwood1]
MSKNYSKQKLLDAVNSQYDSKTAAEMFHVPASTIRRHRREPSLKSHVGRPSYLSNDEEAYFVSLLQLLPEYGFHVSREIALQLATEYCESLGLSYRPGVKWLRLFMTRHTNDIKWLREEKMERERAEGFTEHVRVGWFSTLKEVMIKYNLFDKPHQIFNIDETGFSDKTRGDWVIVSSSRRRVFESSGTSGKNYYTVLIAINAGGFVLAPFVLYSGKYLLDTWCRGGPKGTIYGVTDKGWMNLNAFEYWLEEIFIPSTSHINRPLLLIMDGYTSHISLKIIDLLKKNSIICLILPPHTTHALQPLDLVLFNTVKNEWIKIVKNYFKDGNKILRKSDFPRLLKRLIVEKSAFSPSRVVASFARSGIWPYDEHSMKDKVIRKSNSSSITISSYEHTIPSNFLISHSQSISSTYSSFSASELSNSSRNQQSPTHLQTLLVSPNDDRSIVSSNESISLTLPVSIQPTTFDDDIPLPLDSTSYMDLQPCPIDVTCQSSLPPGTCLIDKEETNKNCPSPMDISFCNHDSSTPFVAVRNVINNFLSKHDINLSMSNSPSNRSRGSRLKNTVGLNITDDEYVALKLKEKEEKEKKKRSRKPRLLKDKDEMSSTNTTTTKKDTKNRVKRNMKNKENQISYDSSIAAGIELLQNAIDFTETTFDRYVSIEEL